MQLYLHTAFNTLSTLPRTHHLHLCLFNMFDVQVLVLYESKLLLQFTKSVHQIRVSIEACAKSTTTATTVHAQVLIRELTANVCIPLVLLHVYFIRETQMLIRCHYPLY